VSPQAHGTAVVARDLEFLLRQARPHALLHALAVGAPGRQRHGLAHDLPHIARPFGAHLRNRALDDRVEVLVGQLAGR